MTNSFRCDGTHNKDCITAAVSLSIHQFAESLGNAIDAKDHNTCRHSEEVAVIAQSLGLALGLSPKYADLLHVAGHLHDIGKIGVPDSVLQKQGPLNAAEYELIKQHPVIGAEIIAPVKALAEMGVREIVLHHHERYDGSGYPDGLKGELIPYGARIIAVADAMSAMLQDRPYRNSMTFDACIEEILANSGTQFDPDIVRALFGVKEQIRNLVHMLKEEVHESEALAV